MKAVIALCLFALVALSAAEQYTDRYDNIDLNEILANRRLLLPYLKCILDQGRCTPEGKELKSHINEALSNDCAKCTEVQRNGTRKVIAHLINNEADYWNQVTAKYDPSRKYAQKYEKELKEIKA